MAAPRQPEHPARTRRPLARVRALLLLAGLLGLGAEGCAGAPSTLAPQGPSATAAASLWWLMLALATLVFLVVAALALGAALRGRGRAHPRQQPPTSEGAASALWSLLLVVVGGVAVPLAILVALEVRSTQALSLLSAPPGPPALVVRVVGHQYWWEVFYPQQGLRTANEIHIPADEPVQVELESADVIHSFWVPQLAGKMDLVPGQTNTLWLQADRPGVYRGQCAEFCGLQHAHMAFLVIAEPADQFAAWLQQQLQPAAQPADPQLQRGAQVFASAGCITCHTLRYGDREVGGQVGPDLTHVGSRRTLAAGRLENTLGNLAGWIGNPQALKPGNRMPRLDLDAEELLAVASYLHALR